MDATLMTQKTVFSSKRCSTITLESPSFPVHRNDVFVESVLPTKTYLADGTLVVASTLVNIANMTHLSAFPRKRLTASSTTIVPSLLMNDTHVNCSVLFRSERFRTLRALVVLWSQSPLIDHRKLD